ncbi:MAG TPA: hypothetical protein VFG04_24640 [Planctomycetaceae bacterium]|nr:hypothetical protein [Planctomycetaceae bacterium]
MSWLRTIQYFVLVMLFASGTLEAAGPPPATGAKLTFRSASANPSIRADAPFAIDYTLASDFEDVLNGELVFTFLDDNEVIIQLRGDPIVVPNGKSSFRVTLPALQTRRNTSGFMVRVALHSTRGTFDLGTHDLLVPLKGKRQFLIGTPKLSAGPIGRLASRLRLDTFRPATSRTNRGDLVTIPADIELRDLPTQAISLYQFDLLLLAEEGFSGLSARQLDAIADWIEQGGRAVVVPTGVLTPAHQAFLRRITSGEPAAPIFVLNQFGRLEAEATGNKPAIIMCRSGFGRALILRTMPAWNADGTFRDLDEPTWARALCFVWNVRDYQTQTILKSGVWIAPLEPQYSVDPSPLEPIEFARSNGLRQMLFPNAVRVMPFGVVVTILAFFLLAIAPGDYFLHGLLRRRWISWVAFPGTCLLFTAATVWIAEGYTGRADHRTELVIIDLGVDGKPRRTSRIEHVVTAETRPLATDVRNGIFAMTNVQPAAPRRTREEDELKRSTVEPQSFAGTLPAAFTVTRLSRQWSPSMHRVTRSGAEVTIPAIDWADLDGLELASEKGRATLLERLHGAVPGCEVVLQNELRQFVTSSSDSSVLREAATPKGWADVMVALARRSDTGLFSIVSHVAPNGAGNLEDLAVADQAPGEWLLQFAERQGEDLIVHRRIMRKKSQAQTEHTR